MAKKRSPRPSASEGTVAPDRAARLYQLVMLLGAGPQNRDTLRRHLGIDVRGFYRDLEFLREAGVPVPLRNRLYTLDCPVPKALSLLPFPDPHLTLGEARQLALGRTPAHRKLKAVLDKLVAAKVEKAKPRSTRSKSKNTK